MQVLRFWRELCKAWRDSSLDGSPEAGAESSASTTQLGALKPIWSKPDIGSRSGLLTSSSAKRTDPSQNMTLKLPRKPRPTFRHALRPKKRRSHLSANKQLT